MLADGVGRCKDLKVVQIEISGNQVGGGKPHTLTGVSPEEYRLRIRWVLVRIKCVLFKHSDSRLPVVPLEIVYNHVELDVRRAIGPNSRPLRARIGERSAGDGR